MTSVQKSKNNFLMMMSAFAVLVVGGSAMVLNNSTTSFNTGASNVEQSVTGIIVKRGTDAFVACKDIKQKYSYGLIPDLTDKYTSQVSEGNDARVYKKCFPLVVSNSLANPYLGRKVLVSGTFKAGVVYAITVSDGSNKPSATSRPPINIDPAERENPGKMVTPDVPPPNYNNSY